MTREDAIERLKTDIYIYADFTENPNEDEFWMAFDMAIKALEQESILDKIRAEIEQAADKQYQIAIGVSDLNERYAHIQMENAYRHSMSIIDKYKAGGSEE